MKIRCQIPLAKSSIVSVGLLRWMTPMGWYHQPTPSPLPCIAQPLGALPVSPGRVHRALLKRGGEQRRALRGATDSAMAKRKKRRFFSSRSPFCDASNTVILDLHMIFHHIKAGGLSWKG